MTNLFGEEDVIEEIFEDSVEQEHSIPELELKHALAIIGYDDIETQIIQMLNSNRMPHALIFAGDKGRGKESFALILSRALLSKQIKKPYKDLSVELTDPIVSRIEKEAHPDLKIVRRLNKEHKNELAGEIVIKSIRDAAHFFTLKSVETDHRIVIVDEADTLNIEAQNAFLKTLEEPPAGALLILIANRPAKLLATIRSRAQVINFSALPKEILIEQGGAALSALPTAIQTIIFGLARGGIGALNQLLDDDIVKAITKINDIMTSKDRGEVQAISESWSTTNTANLDPMQLLSDILHDQLFIKLKQDTLNTKLLTAIDGLNELFDVAQSRYLDKRQVIREAFTIYFDAVQ